VEALQRLQALDFVLVIVWAAIIGWGVKSGLIRQLTMLVATYSAAVAAGQLYKPGGEALAAFGFGREALPQTQLVAYALLFFGVLVLIALIAWRVYPHTGLAGRRGLDAVLGGAVGAVWGTLLLIAVIAILRFYTVTFWPGQEATQLAVAAQIQRAQLTAVLEVLLAPLWQAMALWFPDPIKPGPRD
jgi:uncharacterized membrane protein required for colicin V production